MIRKFTQFIIRIKWFVLAAWVAAALIVFLTAPKLSDVIRTDSGSFLPADSKTAQTNKLIKSLFPDSESHTSLVLVANSGTGVTPEEEAYLKRVEEYFNGMKTELSIGDVLSPYTNEALKDQLISSDGQVALVYLNVNAAPYTEKTANTLNSVKKVVSDKAVEISGVKYTAPDSLGIYVTGDAAISSEQYEATNKSMAIVTKITILLLLTILVIIYRSPVAPILPLFTIGISFLVSRGIIGFLTLWGFKISTFTETFLIAVLFGAGTDYCMLILSRFKEELSHGKDKKQALLDAMTNTGVAIISSGGTVVVGFLFMIFAQFGLFSTTGPSVAIGVVITILAVLTLIPSLIAILGAKVFWPIRNFSKHNAGMDSGFWAKLAALVTARPIRALLISLIIFIPFILSSFGMKVSYDNMKDLPADSPSIKGFTVMTEHFQKGYLLPVRITLKSDQNMWDPAVLKTTDAIAENLLKLDNVDVVRSASRPLGEKLTQASLGSQITLLSSGLKGIDGGFTPLISGLGTIKDSINQIESGLSTGAAGISSGLAGAIDPLAGGVDSTKAGLDQLGAGTGDAIAGANEIAAQLKTLSDGTAQTAAGITQVHASINSSIGSLANLLASQPSLQTNADFQTAYGTLRAVAANLTGVEQSLAQIAGGITQTSDGLVSVSGGLSSVQGGLSASSAALAQISAGLSEMKAGAVSAGTDLQTAADGLKQVAAGIDPISSGLGDMSSGLSQITGAADGYGSGLSDIFYLPPDVFTQYPEFKTAVANYISPDGHGTTFDVILSVTPYSSAALDTMAQIEDTVTFTIKNTNLEGSTFGTSGITSVFAEVRDLVSSDLIIVIVFVLIGIFIVLAILLKSLVAPIYLLLTTVLSYVSTLGLTYLVLCRILGQDGLHWAVPFFTFCVLVALGVDYNIFLITRVKEEYIPGQMRQSVTKALATTGGIITSCGIIMAGTFGSMIFSPMRPMMQIGFAACIGIIIDTFVIRSVVMPAIAVIVGEMSWWPGRKITVTSSDRKSAEK